MEVLSDDSDGYAVSKLAELGATEYGQSFNGFIACVEAAPGGIDAATRTGTPSIIAPPRSPPLSPSLRWIR